MADWAALPAGGVGVGGDEGGEDRDGPGVTQFSEGPHRGGGYRVLEVVDMAEEEVANGVLVVLVPREVSESAQGLGEAAAREGGLLFLKVPKEGVDVEGIVLFAHACDGLVGNGILIGICGE